MKIFAAISFKYDGVNYVSGDEVTGFEETVIESFIEKGILTAKKDEVTKDLPPADPLNISEESKIKTDEAKQRIQEAAEKKKQEAAEKK